MPNFVSIGLFCRPRAAKKTTFAIFSTSAFNGVTSWQQSKKVAHGCTTTNLPLSKCVYLFSSLAARVFNKLTRYSLRVSKSFLYSGAFMAKSGAQSLTFKCVTDRQTDKQIKTQRFWPRWRRVKSEPHHTWHGDRGPRARSCASKTFGVSLIVSPLGVAENLGITRPCQLKTPITQKPLEQIQRSFNS